MKRMLRARTDVLIRNPSGRLDTSGGASLATLEPPAGRSLGLGLRARTGYRVAPRARRPAPLGRGLPPQPGPRPPARGGAPRGGGGGGRPPPAQHIPAGKRAGGGALCPGGRGGGRRPPPTRPPPPPAAGRGPAAGPPPQLRD